MTAGTQKRQPQKGLTFEDVWAMFQETDKELKETGRLIKETRESQKETAKQFQENAKQQKETALQIKELGKQIGDVHKSVGALIETLMAGRLGEKFPEYKFTRSFQRIKIADKNKNPVTEIDILLSDDEWAMAVEVKREPDKDDVEHHLKRMELMREYNLREISGKKLLGAIAGGVVSLEVREYAQKSGFFVLELNGEQVSLLESPEGFVALQG
jgi:predicted AAA+ superfamily ATPase